MILLQIDNERVLEMLIVISSEFLHCLLWMHFFIILCAHESSDFYKLAECFVCPESNPNG